MGPPEGRLVVPADWPTAHERIVWHVRFPRALLAVLVGAAHAVVGTVLQAMVRNPLADPTILGGTASAAAGAVGVMVLGWTFAGTYTLPVAAFTGGIVGYGLAFLLANSWGFSARCAWCWPGSRWVFSSRR